MVSSFHDEEFLKKAPPSQLTCLGFLFVEHLHEVGDAVVLLRYHLLHLFILRPSLGHHGNGILKRLMPKRRPVADTHRFKLSLKRLGPRASIRELATKLLRRDVRVGPRRKANAIV